MRVLSIAKDPVRCLKISTALKGRKHSAEHRRKLSDSCKGRVPWNKGFGDYIVGEKNPRYGKHWSQEWRKRRSAVMKGRYGGSKNPNWKGGRIFYPNWTQLREQCLEKYGFRCVNCLRQMEEKRLVAHHIFPVRDLVRSPLRRLVGDVNNLIPLCCRCHWQIHNGGKYDLDKALHLALNMVGLGARVG